MDHLVEIRPFGVLLIVPLPLWLLNFAMDLVCDMLVLIGMGSTSGYQVCVVCVAAVVPPPDMLLAGVLCRA